MEILPALGYIFGILSGWPPIRILGFSVAPGGGDLALRLILLLLELYVVIGLWRLWESARRFTIGYLCYGFINLTISDLTGQSFSAQGLQDSNPMWWILTYTITLPLFILPIWFLIKRKSAFVKSTTLTQAST